MYDTAAISARTKARRGRMPDAQARLRTPTQIADLQCRYWCWLLTRDDKPAAEALLIMTLDRAVGWSRHFERLVFLIGEEAARVRLGPEAAQAWPALAKAIV